METDNERITEVSPDRIVVNPFQPRLRFVEEELQELASSIKTVGLVHPPVVRPISDSDRYELISGERRFRAAVLAGLEKIPVLIRFVTSPVSAQAALIENIQRVDLNPLEIAYALSRLMREFGLNQDQIAERIGKKRSSVANYVRLLTLPDSIQENIKSGSISMGHAKVILSVDDVDKRIILSDLILKKQLSVRETEAAAKKICETKRRDLRQEPKNPDRYAEALIRRIREKLGTEVTLETDGLQGRLCINFYSLDDLDRLTGLLGLSEGD